MKSFLLLLTISISFASCSNSDNNITDNNKRSLSPEDFRVKGLEEIEPAYAQFDGDIYAGLLPMDNRNRTGELMFWLFAPHGPTVNDSLAIWFNGGPGCSSFNGGVFFEHSPVTVTQHEAGFCCGDAHDPLQYNEYAWTKATHMLYVEQVRFMLL
jgi:carboxypeptidase C (cathepsin A)